MSLLPQRKKSAEEIAKLRESLGVPALPVSSDASADASPATASEATVENEVVDTLISDSHEATVVHPAEAIPLAAPLAAPLDSPDPVAVSGPKPVHSLKRSERMPVVHDEPAPAAAPRPMQESSPTDSRPPKVVRSLKKSEQGPIVVPPLIDDPAPTSKIPFHRHTDEELNEIRRREALALLNEHAPNPRLAAAHLGTVIPGYLLAVAGASCFLTHEFPAIATATCVASALVIAAFIFLRRPISRHHAAFIAVIAMFVLVFGALHFFPHLQHAT